MHVKYNADTGEVIFPLKVGDTLHNVPISEEQFAAGITLERRRKGGKPAAFRLADNSVVEEIWPPSPTL